MAAAVTNKTAKTADATPVAFPMGFLDRAGDGASLAPLHALLSAAGVIVNPATAEGIAAIVAALGGTLNVALTSQPLPAGAATSGKQDTGNTTLSSLLTALQGTLAISAAALPLPAGAATDAKVEAVRALLAGTLGVSATSLPLPTGASTGAKQDTGNTSLVSILTALQGTLATAAAAGENHLGSVGSDSKRITAAPTLTAATTYATGKCLGGLMTLSSLLRSAGKSATAQSATVHAKVANTAAIDLVIFRDTPLVTTGLVDNATFAVDPSDFDKVSKVLNFTAWNSLGTPSLARLDSIGALMSAASGVDLKAILVARGSVAITTTSDISVTLGVYQD